ncbi:MAG: papain-like cysteine peptidase [Ruminococcus sp.]|nr:papain-like cysteine peptidase [Ruminococcus sp.]
MVNKYDLVFSIGPFCRPAYYLTLTGLRTYAYPFDWLGTDLKTVLRLFESDFNVFLNSFQDVSEEWHIPGLKRIKDNNGIIIAHHIKEDEDIGAAILNCKKLMQKRYNRLKEHIKEARNIAMLTNQNVNLEELKSFLKAIGLLFPNKNITLINIQNRLIEEPKLEIDICKNLKIIEYYFNDINKDDDSENINPNFWIGNEEKWLEVIDTLRKGKENE